MKLPDILKRPVVVGVVALVLGLVLGLDRQQINNLGHREHRTDD